MLRVLVLSLVLIGGCVCSADKARVECESAFQMCTVEIDLENDGKTHRVELVREQRSLFAEDSTIAFLDGETIPIASKLENGIRFHSKLEGSPWQHLWASALISHDGKNVIDGIFVTEAHGVVEVQEGSVLTTKRRRTADSGTDEAWELPEGKPWLKTIQADNKMNRLEKSSNDMLDVSTEGVIERFFPGCFPGDSVTHVFKLNLVLDWGLYQSLTAGVSGDDNAKRSRVLSNLESVFAIGKLLYLSQLNVRVEVQKVVFGKATDAVPISRSSLDGTCTNALNAMKEMLTWANENNPKDPSGYWMLLSNCFSGVNGVSYIGNICGGTNNAGVAAYSWLVMFHELGHGFGATHSFENGLGLTGGIMDYGDGMYNGVVQFHPDKRAEICSVLSYTKNKSPQCKFFSISASSSSCGDGVMDKSEQCECLDQSKRCDKCVNCKLTDAAVECSSAQFVVRTSLSADLVIVEQAALASPECCIRNKFAAPKTLCGSGLLNACGAAGKCVPLCTNYLESNNANCNFDTSGCLLGCVWKNRCRYDLTFDNLDGTQGLISALPDGSQCISASGGRGTCLNALCVGQGTNPSKGPVLPTPRPTAPSIPSTKTKTPTLAPTYEPTEAPVISELSRCAVLRNKQKCSKGACVWCETSCKPKNGCTTKGRKRKAKPKKM